MKKGTAILLAAIMLLTVIRPVLSLHLCMDTLASVGLFVEADACCGEPMKASGPATPEEDKTRQGSSADISAYHEDCCEFRTIEISTDAFSRDAEQPYPTTSAQKSAGCRRDLSFGLSAGSWILL